MRESIFTLLLVDRKLILVAYAEQGSILRLLQSPVAEFCASGKPTTMEETHVAATGTSSIFENALQLDPADDLSDNSDGPFLDPQAPDSPFADLVCNSDLTNSSTSTKHASPSVSEKGHELVQLRREKRMQSNRDSARRSRLKKQVQLDEINERLEQLRTENGYLRYQVSLAMQKLEGLAQSNHSLREHGLHLSNRLQYLNHACNYNMQQPAAATAPDALEDPSGFDSIFP